MVVLVWSGEGGSERDECGGCCIYEKDGLFLIWWGPTPAKNSERHANRKTERDKE